MRGSEATQRRLRTVIPIICVFIPLFAILGNICSVVGMVTANYLFVVIEETLWACIFFFGGCSALCLWHYGCDAWSFDYGSNCFGWDINPFDEWVDMVVYHWIIRTNYIEVPIRKNHTTLLQCGWCACLLEGSLCLVLLRHLSWLFPIFRKSSPFQWFGCFTNINLIDWCDSLHRKWYNRLRNDELNGATYFDTVEGFNDAASERRPTQFAGDWDQDMFWMSAYFSGAVLASIFLMYAPGRIVPEMVSANGQVGITPIEDSA